MHFTRLNRHYKRAILLARMILSATSFELGDGPVDARCFLINMNTVFEEFVREALRDALHEAPGLFGKRELCFDEGKTRRVEPDLMWSTPDGSPVFVGDAKYKRLDDGLRYPDLYQILAYMAAANLRRGMLIYPEGEAPETSLTVANLGRTIEICTLDISGGPAETLASVDRIAGRIRAMARQP